MKYKHWIHTRKPVRIIPTKWYFSPWPKRVPVQLEQMPVVFWLLLKDVVWNINYAPYIVSTYLDINPAIVVEMNAGRVIALFNHIRSQVEKCNKSYEWAMMDLLPIGSDVDNSHFQGIENLAIIYDLMSYGNKTLKEAEQITFSEAISYLKIKNAYIRSDQNRYLKNKTKK